MNDRDTSDVVAPMTERLLVEAGIGAGMRVLDVGCGRGNVSFLVARVVGEQGEVVGVDREPRPLAAATKRARELRLSRVTFVEGDFCALALELGQFDAAVGRRVLMYQRDPVDSVRRLAQAVRPGGLIVFQEQDSTMPPTSLAPLPLHERVREWIWRTLEHEGTNIHMGFHLASVLEQAGLTAAQVRAEAIVQTPTAHFPTAPILRQLLPRIVAHGIATEGEVDVDTLDQRLIAERMKANATYIGEMVFGAWARKPG